MPYTELTNYLEKGQTRIKGTLTQWNALGLALGALTGHLLARSLDLPSSGLVVVCTLLGFGLSIRYHGIAIPKRIAVLGLWLVQAQAGYTVSCGPSSQHHTGTTLPRTVRRATSGRAFLPTAARASHRRREPARAGPRGTPCAPAGTPVRNT